MFQPFHNCSAWLASGLLALAACSAHGNTIDIDVAGAVSHDVQGDAANTFMTLTLAPGAHVTAVGWNVSLTAHAGSWLTEMTVSLLESTGSVGVNLAPGYADNFSGTARYASGGTIDLIGSGHDFHLGSDGQLMLQFFEDFNDLAGADGLWDSGLITVEFSAAPIPEPAAWVLWSMGGAATLLASRRRHAGRRTQAIVQAQDLPDRT